VWSAGWRIGSDGVGVTQLSVAALALVCGGVLLLFLAWRTKDRVRLPVVGGWLCLLAALWLFARDAGLEYGLVYGLALPGLAALAVVGLAAQRRSAVAGGPAESGVRWPGPAAALRTLERVVLIVVVAGAACAAMALSIGYLLGASPANRFALAGVLLPVLWGVSAYWLGAASRPRVRAAVIAVLGSAGYIVLRLGVWQ